MTQKRFFRKDGSELTLHDTEDKTWWLDYGEKKEQAFLAFCRQQGILGGLDFNPERSEGKQRGAPEFIYNDCLLDLKVQHQPFFEAEKMYGIPPRYAVTLNWRDVRDVRTKYSDCLIAYWVNWRSLHYIKTQDRKTMPPRVLSDITIEPLHGVWLINPVRLFELEDDAIKKGNLHWYQRRFGDIKGNAKSSYVIDIRDLDLIWTDPSFPALDKP